MSCWQDIITYRVESVDPIFKVREAAVGTGKFSNPSCNVSVTDHLKGAKCGAVYVDRYFKSWLRKKLGDQTFSKIRKADLIDGSKLMWDFETAKIGFSGDNQNFSIDLPREVGIKDDDALGIKDYAMTMSR